MSVLNWLLERRLDGKELEGPVEAGEPGCPRQPFPVLTSRGQPAPGAAL